MSDAILFPHHHRLLHSQLSNLSTGHAIRIPHITTDDVTVGTTSSPEGVFKNSVAHVSLTLLVLGLLILAAIIGNAFVIAAVVLERNLHNVANYLVASLASADLMVATLVMPLAAVNEVSVRWFLGETVCDIWVIFDVICCTASILHLLAISIDRYWAVTRVDYIRNRSARRILAMVAISWSLALAISIPPLFFPKAADQVQSESFQCEINQDMWYQIVSTAGAFFAPFFAVLVIYLKVFFAARASIRKEKFRKTRRQRRLATTVQQNSTAVGGAIALDSLSNASNVSPVTDVKTSPVTEPVNDSKDRLLCDEQRPCNGSASRHNEVECTGRARLDTAGSASSLRFTSPVSGSPLLSPHLSVPPHKAALRHCSSLHDLPASSLPACNPHASSPPASGLQADGSAPGVRGSFFDLTKEYIERKSVHQVSPRTRERRAREKLEQKRELKAARTLAIITGSFCICWLPFFTVAILRPFCPYHCSFPPLFLSIINWLGYFNSVLNPIIYTIFNPDFRLAFRKILFGKYKRGDYRRNGDVTRHVMCK